jgi:hypothetical protein
MNARGETRRKGTCLNAESPITCSQAPWTSPANLQGSAMPVISLRGLYRLGWAEHNL